MLPARGAPSSVRAFPVTGVISVQVAVLRVGDPALHLALRRCFAAGFPSIGTDLILGSHDKNFLCHH